MTLRNWLGKAAVALLLLAGNAHALPTAGGSCGANECKAEDAATVGGNCYGHYCVAGSASNSGGNCFGDGCKAGDGGTSGGNCVGRNCTPGGYGRPGQRLGAYPKNMGCCMAWVQQGAIPADSSLDNIVTQCDFAELLNESTKSCQTRFRMSGENDYTLNELRKSAAGCVTAQRTGQKVSSMCPYFLDRWRKNLKEVAPVETPAQASKPQLVTSYRAIRIALREAYLARKAENVRQYGEAANCQFDCQSFNSASRSCVGAARNGCYAVPPEAASAAAAAAASAPACPYNCQTYNPASGTCVGARMNACGAR